MSITPVSAFLPPLISVKVSTTQALKIDELNYSSPSYTEGVIIRSKEYLDSLNSRKIKNFDPYEMVVSRKDSERAQEINYQAVKKYKAGSVDYYI